MIYAIGVGSDGTFGHFVEAAASHGVEIVSVDLREVAAGGDWRLAIPDDGRSWLATATERYALDPEGSFFCRIIDLSALQRDVARARRWQGLVAALLAWLDHVPGLVVNRPEVRADNGSKPLHELSLARAGFAVPESLTSSDPARLRAFAAAGPTIVKAASGVRATSRLVGPADFAGFIPWQGPVHLQRYITGTDVRAHVVGMRVHAEEIISAAVDYRAAPPDEVTFAPCEPHLSRRMIEYTKESGMSFAGWDFKVAEDGAHWCLEVNPMPGYDWYDRRLEGAVSASLLDLLSDGTSV